MERGHILFKSSTIVTFWFGKRTTTLDNVDFAKYTLYGNVSHEQWLITKSQSTVNLQHVLSHWLGKMTVEQRIIKKVSWTMSQKILRISLVEQAYLSVSNVFTGHFYSV